MGMETSVHKTPSYDARISNGLSLNVPIIAIGNVNPKKSLVLVPD